MHGARSALAVIATLLGARERDRLAQAIEQRCARVDAELMQLSIHAQCEWLSSVGTFHLRRIGGGVLAHEVACIDRNNQSCSTGGCKKRPAAHIQQVRWLPR